MHPTDVALVGLALDIAGAILLARGFMMKALHEVFYESRTFFGGNLFFLKSGVLQRAEAWGGAGLLFVGFVLQIVGSLHVVPEAVNRRVVGWFGLVELLALSAVAFLIGQYCASRVGRRQFYTYKLRNYVPAEPFPSSTVEQKQELLRAGVMYDLHPRKAESAAAFAARLSEHVRVLGMRYRGKATEPGESARAWE